MKSFGQWMEARNPLLSEEGLEDRVADLNNWTVQKDPITGYWDRWEDPGDYPSGAGAGPRAPGDWYLVVEGSWKFSIKLPAGSLSTEGDVVYLHHLGGKVPAVDFLQGSDFAPEALGTMEDEVKISSSNLGGSAGRIHQGDERPPAISELFDLDIEDIKSESGFGWDVLSFEVSLKRSPE